MISGWFDRTTFLNSSWIALVWQFLKRESPIVRLDGFGHSERICTRFVAPNGVSWVGEMISERSKRVIALFGTVMSVSQLKSCQPCNTLISGHCASSAADFFEWALDSVYFYFLENLWFFWLQNNFAPFGRDLAKFNQFPSQNDDYSAPQAKILSIFRF